MAERVPAEVFPPGEFLRDELDARGWQVGEFAEILGRSTRHVSEIVNGKRGITPTAALEFSAALGTSAAFWLNLDAAYQLSRSEPISPTIARTAHLRERFPVRDMIKRGWIEDSENVDVLEARLKQFYGLHSLDDTPHLAHAAKKRGEPDNYGELDSVQLAWLFRVKQIAATIPLGNYSEQALRNALPRLQGLRSEPEEARHVPGILAECGVRFVIVEPFPSSKIDGVCFWLDGSKPVIGITLRYDRIDNFWFVLRHEIEHVLHGHATFDSELDMGADASSSAPDQEGVANHAAADFCVPQEELENFVARVHPMYSEHQVVGFARAIGVHPGLVIGQLQRKLNRYNFLRAYLVKVRDVIAQSAMTDGYGRFCPVNF